MTENVPHRPMFARASMSSLSRCRSCGWGLEAGATIPVVPKGSVKRLSSAATARSKTPTASGAEDSAVYVFTPGRVRNDVATLATLRPVPPYMCACARVGPNL